MNRDMTFNNNDAYARAANTYYPSHRRAPVHKEYWTFKRTTEQSKSFGTYTITVTATKWRRETMNEAGWPAESVEAMDEIHVSRSVTSMDITASQGKVLDTIYRDLANRIGLEALLREVL